MTSDEKWGGGEGRGRGGGGKSFLLGSEKSRRTCSRLLPDFQELSVPKHRNRREIAASFKSQITTRELFCKNRRKYRRNIAAFSRARNRLKEPQRFPRFQNRNIFWDTKRKRLYFR